MRETLLTLGAGVVALVVLLVRLDQIARAGERIERSGNTNPSDLAVGGIADGREDPVESNTVLNHTEGGR